jgi:hypothetical protein
MAIPKIISAEKAHADNDEKIREWSESKIARMEHALRHEKLNFDIEKFDTEESAKSAHRAHNASELDDILAEAARAEAAAKRKSR